MNYITRNICTNTNIKTQFDEDLECTVGFFQTLKCCACMLVNLFETGFTWVCTYISNSSTCTIQLWCTVYIMDLNVDPL